MAITDLEKIASVSRKNHENDNYASVNRTKDYLYWFLFGWTIVILIVLWLEFLFPKYVTVPYLLANIYVMLLGLYAGGKEAIRHINIKTRERLGEVMVIIWGGSALAMLLIMAFKNLGLQMLPGIMLELTIEVAALYAATFGSKLYYLKKKNSEINKIA